MQQNNSDLVSHLQMIQAIIDRMGRNSFAMKSWTVVLVSAIFALASNGADYRFFYIAFLPTVVFWLLDGYYLWQERLFRRLYNAVRTGEHASKDPSPFSMDFRPYAGEEQRWRQVCLSTTVALFYSALLVATAAASIVAWAISRT